VKNLNRLAMLAPLIIALLFLSYGYASYTVTNLNTTIALNKNNTAQVTELLDVVVSNASISQYQTDRVALNLTLSTWQALIGPKLVWHVLNSRLGVQNFRFLPGPLVMTSGGNGKTVLLMLYSISNVTTVEQIAPRAFMYTFNSSVLNFEHTQIGVVLPKNTTLNIILPRGSIIGQVYPIPDAPANSFSNNYKNITKLSWYNGEPLSKFSLTYEIHESLGDEVIGFFVGVYNILGVFSYILVALVIIGLILYTYFKASS